MKNPIIVLTGPTASGKTSVALEVAGKYDCEIICADSMTVYQGMDIGTDKPTLVDTRGIPHHLLNICKPNEEFNVSIFISKVQELVKQIHNRGNVPILVGGSVMYIDAFIYGYDIPNVPPNLALRKKLEAETNEKLFSMLCKLDPDCEWTVDKHNKRRLIRAIEVCLESGKPFSAQKTKHPLPKNVLYLAVDRDREVLYKSINDRVDIMFDNGFVEEVKNLCALYDKSTALQAAGYRQIIEYLDGDLSLEEAIEKTKQVHRNYAKRQLTWLKKNNDVVWIKNSEEAEGLIEDFLL